MGTEEVEKASALATAIEAFAHAHPLIASLIAAIVASWMATSIFKHILRALLPDHIQNECIRLFDCAVAGVAAWFVWPGEPSDTAWRAITAICAAGGSPLLYWAVTEAVCWKFPSARKFFTLRELDPDQTTDKDPPL